MSGCPQGVSTVQIQSAPAARHDSWAGAFGGDAVLTAAMLDRTLHDATIITERNDRLEKAPEPVYQRDQDVPDWPVPARLEDAENDSTLRIKRTLLGFKPS
jgi:hypothetical protein